MSGGKRAAQCSDNHGTQSPTLRGNDLHPATPSGLPGSGNEEEGSSNTILRTEDGIAKRRSTNRRFDRSSLSHYLRRLHQSHPNRQYRDTKMLDRCQ